MTNRRCAASVSPRRGLRLSRGSRQPHDAQGQREGCGAESRPCRELERSPAVPSVDGAPRDPGRVTDPRWPLTSCLCGLRGGRDTRTGQRGPSWTAACPRTRPWHAGPASRPPRRLCGLGDEGSCSAFSAPFSPRWLRRGNHGPHSRALPRGAVSRSPLDKRR